MENFIIVDMPEIDDAQIILAQLILATTVCHIDVRKGWITFEVEERYVVFCHTKEKVFSPSSSLLDALPLFPEIDMEDVLNCEDPLYSDWISYKDPTKGMLRWSLLLLCHLTRPRLRSMYLTSLL